MSDSAHYVAVADKVIASDLLYYISNEVHNTPIATVVTTCHNFYTNNDYVFNQRKQLCDATNEICHAHCNDNKRLNNIEDICAILTRRDSQALFIPKFASLDLSNVPISDAGDPSLGQLMGAIMDMKRNMVTTDMLRSSFNEF